MEKVERVKVIEKKEKRGGEKFDKEFVRNGHQVSKVMKKVEKNNKKMEKLALKKEGFAPIVPHGEQRFDAHFYQPEAGEGKLGVETMLAGCASVAVKKAEVWEAIHKKQSSHSARLSPQTMTYYYNRKVYMILVSSLTRVTSVQG